MQADGYMLLAAKDTPALHKLAQQWLTAVLAINFAATEDATDALAAVGEPFAELCSLRWQRLQTQALLLGYDGGCLIQAGILKRSAELLGITFRKPWPAEEDIIICLPR